MAIVPRAKREVEQQAGFTERLNVSAPKGLFGEGVGEIFETAGKEIGGMVERIQKKAQNAEESGAKDKISQKIRDSLYNPETGYKNLQGKEPAEKYKDYLSGYDEFVEKELLKDIPEGSRARIRAIALSKKGELDSHLQKHQFTEHQAYVEGKFKGERKSIEEDAVLFYDDPKILGNKILENEKSIERQFEGMSAEEVALKKKQATSELMDTVVGKMLDDNAFIKAEDTLKNSKDSLLPEVYSKLKEEVKLASLDGKAENFATESYEKGLLKTAAIDRANKIKDEDLRKEAKRKIKTHYAHKEQIAKERREAFSEPIYFSIMKGQGDNVPGRSMKEVSDKTRNAFRNLKDMHKQGKRPLTDKTVFNDLLNLATEPDFQKSLTMERVYEKADKLSPEDLNYFKETISERTKNNGSIPRGFQREREIGKIAMRAGGMDPRNKANQEHVDGFMTDYSIAVREWKRDNNAKHIPEEDAKKLADRLMMDIVTNVEKGLLWNSVEKKKAFQIDESDNIAPPNDRDLKQLQAIDDESKEKIRKSLIDQDLPADDVAVLNRYRTVLELMKRNKVVNK